MMDPRLLAIPLAFIALAAIACWYAISAKGKWWPKLLLIVIIPAFGIVAWYSMTSYLGWPTSQSLSGKVLLLWADIHEPDPRTGEPGAIYIWLVPVEEEQIGSPGVMAYRPSDQEPRAYRLRYSRKAHEQLFKAQQKRRKGKPVILEFAKEGEDTGSGSESGSSEDSETTSQNGAHRGYQGYEGNDQEFQMYDLPEPELPPKKEE